MTRREEIEKAAMQVGGVHPDGVVMDYATHDEYGFDLHRGNIELKPSEVRELAEMGWCLGYACDFDEEIMNPWMNPSEHTDEELMALWNEYKMIHTYA